jgi:hypothetical protein
LPAGVPKPSKLDRTKGAKLCKPEDVEFWELDRSFMCRERWSLEKDVRTAINAMYHNLRALEEIFILGSETERYYNWLASRLDGCERLLSVLNVNTAIGNEVLHIGLKTANAMERLKDLARVNLGSEEKFKSVQEKLERKLILHTCSDSSDM